MIEHFEFLATQHGIDVAFVNTGYSEERLLAGVRRLLERNVDGLAVLTSEVSVSAVDGIRASAVPVVFLNQPSVTGDFLDQKGVVRHHETRLARFLLNRFVRPSVR